MYCKQTLMICYFTFVPCVLLLLTCLVASHCYLVSYQTFDVSCLYYSLIMRMRPLLVAMFWNKMERSGIGAGMW